MKTLNKISIKFTDAAAKKAKYLILNENNPKLNLRVYITGGGCSGFKYCFILDEKIQKEDFSIENSGVKLIIDHMSLQYIIGSSVDHVEEIKGSYFIVNNPNAKTTCSCGLSFSI